MTFGNSKENKSIDLQGESVDWFLYGAGSFRWNVFLIVL